MSAQVRLSVVTSDRAVLKGRQIKTSFAGAAEARKALQELLFELHDDGYLLASVDSISGDTLNIKAHLSAGSRFSVAYLGQGNLDPAVATRLGITEKLFLRKPFKRRVFARMMERIIVYYENNGYPFASASIDSVQTTETELRGRLRIDRNKFFRMDSVIISGDARVSRRFMLRYLGIKENMPYNEALFASISNKLKQLPFVTATQPVAVRLTERTNRLVMTLGKKNASQFDGIIGLLPDADTRETIITGDVKLRLVNGILRSGETFDLEWRRLQTQTQDFNGKFIYPFLFGSPAGADYNLKIYRRDTTFIDITNNIGLQYYYSGLNYVRIYYRQRVSSLISTSGLSNITTLPEYADVSGSSYGAGVLYEKLDYRFNPRSGVTFSVNAQAGNRNIAVNTHINEAAYNNLLLHSAQYQYEAAFGVFVPIAGNNVIRLNIQSASVFGNSTVFTNELFRIGGLRTLRGFDEESIFASTFVIPTIEYRFLFERNSNLLVFAEGAWYENNSNRRYISDMPLSVGAGVNFETKAGILSLNYAVGNQFGNGFDVRSGKIHFGLIALF